MVLPVLPSWSMSWIKSDLPPYQSIFTPSETQALRWLVNHLLPPVEKVGGLDLGVDSFLEKLFSDCYEKDIQEIIRKNLALIASEVPQNGTDKLEGEPLQQVLDFISGEEAGAQFYTLFKNEAIRGFTSSKLVMEKYYGYLIAPGYYHGCEPIN